MFTLHDRALFDVDTCQFPSVRDIKTFPSAFGAGSTEAAEFLCLNFIWTTAKYTMNIPGVFDSNNVDSVWS